MSNKIVIVTPLKDEIDNIDCLINSIEAQSIAIDTWVIVENGSTDGSCEKLQKINYVNNVKSFILINFTLPNDKYELGVKYSTVVNYGFTYIKQHNIDYDYIGICDADCFPTKNYYKELTNFMAVNSIDVASGIGLFDNDRFDGESKTWVRGNCRLWNKNSFLKAGYIVGPSADTLSLGRAEMMGFKCVPNLKLFYRCREMGERTRYSYYGFSSYYRGITPFYAVMKTFNYFRILQVKQGFQYIYGYFKSFINSEERIQDKELLNYFSNTIERKIHERKNRISRY